MSLKEIDFLKKIEKIENRKSELEEELLKLKIKEKKRRLEKKYGETNEKRRARTHHLITIGGLVQVARIDTEDKDTLLGFFLKFHRLTKEEIEDCKFSGQMEFKKKTEEREQKNFKKKIEKMIKEQKKK